MHAWVRPLKSWVKTAVKSKMTDVNDNNGFCALLKIAIINIILATAISIHVRHL